MLVLSRKLGEKIVIGDNVVVTIVKIDNSQIRVGIEAPPEIQVYRKELESPGGKAPIPLPKKKTEKRLISQLTRRTSKH